MIYLYLFGTCFHFIYVFMIIGKEKRCITTVEKNPEISRYKSDFTIEDYIRENMR